jgi:hypothetical protein
MTGRLHRLEQRGLIARSPDPNDRRGLRVTLTREGREVIDQAVQAGVETQERLLARLAPEQRRQLDALLRELLASASAGSTAPERGRAGQSFLAGVEPALDPESDDDEPESEEEDEELESFFSFCLASCLSAPDFAEESISRLRLAVP